jgi:hypothetical protein
MEVNKLDKEEFDNAIKYFQSIINTNNYDFSQEKMGVTFIGIKTNISGILKLHIYLLFFPFVKSDIIVPYSNQLPNMHFKDLSFYASKSFYLWIYEEMRKQKSIVILSLESNILKVVPGTGDALISVNINCNEKKEWMELDYEAWYEKKTFTNVFTISIVNPFLYMVPFPVKPIIIKTIKRINNYVEIINQKDM